MNENVLSNIYGSLFTPVKTFEELVKSENPPVFDAFVVVLMISMIGTLQSKVDSPLLLLLTAIICIFTAVVSWIGFALILNSLVRIFTNENRLDYLLVLTGFALTPWFIMPSINLFKLINIPILSIIGVISSVLLGVCLSIWAIGLFLYAVAKVYGFSIGKTIILVSMPIFGTIILCVWISGGIFNLINIIGGQY